ncbi:hypothetical protein AVEN_190512-1 [Araneus ventricosus]|uniref:Uncharacterized protein n=1 Tax=Araneus ventricosus TaxID=182803 RepID=A0A4Y2MLS9_ARAVE|nr:hypothetical protein AVEN_190512-1 [Araneus ventricosus]
MEASLSIKRVSLHSTVKKIEYERKCSVMLLCNEVAMDKTPVNSVEDLVPEIFWNKTTNSVLPTISTWCGLWNSGDRLLLSASLFSISVVRMTFADIYSQCVVLISPSLFCGPTLFPEASVTSFTIRSTTCVCERNLILFQPSMKKFMRTNLSENCRWSDITSLPVNEIYNDL